jgi:rhodanese-related sulfurtransferase
MKKTPQEIGSEIEANKALLLDVREKDEWTTGHFVLARSYPLSLLQKKIPDDIEQDATIYIHCAHGKRAQIAMNILKAYFPHVHALVASLDEIERDYALHFLRLFS